MSMNPAKDLRRAMRVARAPGGRIGLDSGGSAALQQAIKQFSRARARQWDPQGTVARMNAWDPQGTAMMQARRLMMAEPEQEQVPQAKPHSLIGDLGGQAKQGEDLMDVVQNGYRAFGPKPAAIANPGGAPMTGRVALAGSAQAPSAGPSPSRSVGYKGAGPVQNLNIPPEGRALLATIGGPGYESNGSYTQRFNQPDFDDFSWHPGTYGRITSGPNAGKFSNAAGRYQFLSTTWNEEANRLGLKDFSPASQDAAAWDLAQGTYAQRTGRDLAGDLRDQSRLPAVASALRSQWTSLPGGIEQGASLPHFVKGFSTNLQSEMARQNAPTSSPIAPVQAAGPGAPTYNDDRSTWQKDKFGTPITPQGWMPPELRGTPGAANAGQPPAPALHDAGPLAPSAVAGAPKAGIHIHDPDNPDNDYPGPREMAAPQIAAPPPAALPVPNQGIPDAPLHTASLGPSGDNPAPQPAQQQDTSPPPQQPDQSDIYNKVAFGPSVQGGWDDYSAMLAPDKSPDTPTAARGGSMRRSMTMPRAAGGQIGRAMNVARKHRASGGTSLSGWGLNSTPAGSTGGNTFDPSTALYEGGLPGWGLTPGQMEGLQAESNDLGMNWFGGTPSQAPAPTPAPTPAPPIENNTVGNDFQLNGTQGAPVTNGQYNNTLDEVLGTNSPTGQDVFGFQYPNVPPPQPNPYTGPVSTTSGVPSYGAGGMFGYQGSVGATPTGSPPTLLSPAPVNYPGSSLTYLPPMIGGGNTNNSPASTLGSLPMATPTGAKRGGAVKKAVKVARSS